MEVKTEEKKAMEEMLKQIEEFGKNRKKDRWFRFVFFPILFLYLEVVFRLAVWGELGIGIIRAGIIGLAVGGVLTVVTTIWKKQVNRIVSLLFLVLASLYYIAQLIYYTVFLRFFSVALALSVGGDVLEFKEQILNTVANKWFAVVCLLVPFVLWIVGNVTFLTFDKLDWKKSIWFGVGGIFSYLLLLLVLVLGSHAPHTAYYLYFEDWESVRGAKEYGVLALLQKDIAVCFFGGEEDTLGELIIVPQATVTPMPTPTKAVSPMVTEVPPENREEITESETTATPTATSTPTPTPFVQQTLYDFSALAEQETTSAIQTLHQYFAAQEPTMTNAYTGRFEGYNLILITAEGFSPWAVVEDVTPTLYKMIHTGFVFENFYTPLWYTSTSDGEYVACTGLLPYSTNSMTKSANNAMPFAFGNQFRKLGYLTKAYHNHSYQYYHRDESHPNLGYEYQGIGNGMVLPFNGWPRSDEEMMQVTVPEYVTKEPFHVYYMTVSGHMEYTFVDNSMSYRNKDVVKDLPYSEEAKAYIACNYELEKALTHLLEQLEVAGVLENTVIALSADHYPYGLEKQYIDELAGHEVEENFELYKNHFILWCADMEEPVVVEKYCSSLDIAPTLSNLFHLPYDSRLYMGTDILSDSEPLVIFLNKSFITDKVMYNSITGEIIKLTDEPLPDDYVKNKMQVVKNKWIASEGILKQDYYSYLLEADE